MTQIPAKIIQEIRDRLDIEQVVGQSVRLSRKGQRLWGLCPFHREKTPSFSVSRERQMFHCFGCEAGGDVFKFVMSLEGISFPEAVRALAGKAGVALPEVEESAGERLARQEREKLLETNTLAAAFFREELAKTPRAQAYLRDERGLEDATITRFGLGFAPPGYTGLIDHFRKRGIDPSGGVALGLFGRSARDGRLYDRLRGRIVFPIEGPGGVLGFGARRADWVDPEGPKYLNSPESPLYDKSSILYGLERAKSEIRRARRVLLVEGYLDVIALAQAGLPIAVASCGTALAKGHLFALARLTDELVTLYDGDPAGHEAAKKASLLLLAEGIAVRVAEIPEGDDPDTFVQRNGRAPLEKLIDEAPAAIDFFVTQARAAHSGGGIAGVTRAMEAVKPFILAIRDPFERDVAIEAAASHLSVGSAVLKKHLSIKPTPRPAEGPPARTPAESLIPIVEIEILRALVEAPDRVLAELERRRALHAFSHEAVRRTVEAARSAREGGDPFDAPRAFDALRSAGVNDERQIGQLRRSVMGTLPERDDLSELITRLLEQHRKNAARQLARRIEQGDPEAEAQLAAEARAIPDLTKGS